MNSQPKPSQTDSADHSASVNNDDTVATPSASAGTAESNTFGPPVTEGEVGTLGAYRIIKELGQGGMGAVFAAVDTRLERRLAMKVMRPEIAMNSSARERFLREARAVARIKHDNVVTIYGADERNGVPYIAMEFLVGYPLDEYLKIKGLPSLNQVLRIAAETASGLDAAHKLGLIHRDIKPGNLWLEAPKGRVKVLDFGLAKMVDSEIELTKSGTMVGTPAYMSPEQARGERVDARADLYSLGAVLYRLCTNRLPFQGSSTMAILMALTIEEPPPVQSLNPDVPESLAMLIHQLLSKEADARPKSAAEVVTRLQAIARELSGSHSHSPATQPQVLYIPMAVSVSPEAANPFADLDASDTAVDANVPAPVPATTTKPTHKKPGVFPPWAIAAATAFAALVVSGVIIVIKNKDGSETRIDVPDGATVTVQEKGNPRPVAQVPLTHTLPTGPTTSGLQKEVTAELDRKAAEWVLSRGGSVTVAVSKNEVEVKAVTNLPKDHFTLTDIDLQYKTVPDTERVNLQGLVGLTGLNLEATSITDSELVCLKELKNLTSLSLGSTKVTDAGLAHLKDLNHLQTLTLGHTRVSGAGLIHLKDLKNLRYLNLKGAQVTDAGLAHIKELKELILLELGCTQVTDAGLVHIKELKEMTKLYLYLTKVTDAGLAHIKEITYLNLNSTQVTDAGLAHLKEQKSLSQLYLSSTQVTDVGLAHLKELKELTYLNLDHTQVTDAGLIHLQKLKNLTGLILTETKVTAKGLEEFHAAVPGCRIQYDVGVIEPKK